MLNRAFSRSQNYILPAPVGGLNCRDSLDNMSETDAIIMDNYYPSETNVCLRGGYKIYALEGLGLKVESLITFSSPQNKRMFAAANGKIIDITSDNYTVDVDNLYANNWNYVQFRNRLLLVNGMDNPLTYFKDGNDVWT